MIRGRQRDLREVKNVTMQASIHNRFDVEVVDAATGEVKQWAKAENVICDQLWSRLLTPSSYFNYIQYGTGTGTPSSTDTKLFAFFGYLPLREDDDICEYSHAGHWYSLRRKGQLAENVAVGQTLTEVGIAYGTSSDSLCTHAMLRDMNGNQISIQKTDTDVINIYATVFIHWPDNLVSGGVQILPCAYTNYGFLAYLAGRYRAGSLGAPPAKPPGFALLTVGRKFINTEGENTKNCSYDITHKFNVTTKSITSTVNRIPVGGGNWTGGARGVVMFTGFSDGNPVFPAIYFEAGKSDWFSGSTVKGEAIGTGDGATTEFATEFDDPEAAAIHVDGEAVSDVTVDKTPTVISDMALFFDIVAVEKGIAYPGINNRDTGMFRCEHGIYINPYWQYGIDSFFANSIQSVCVSDDLVSWEYIVGSDSSTEQVYETKSVPKELQFKKYWNVKTDGKRNSYIRSFTSPTLTGKNIHFATPPAAGSVITADYFTKRIAKDSNHVFDLTLTIQLGERTM